MDVKSTQTRIVIIAERATIHVDLDKTALVDRALEDVLLDLETATMMESARQTQTLIQTIVERAETTVENTQCVLPVFVDANRALETATTTMLLMDVKSTSTQIQIIAGHATINAVIKLIAVEERVFATRALETATITFLLMDVKPILM